MELMQMDGAVRVSLLTTSDTVFTSSTIDEIIRPYAISISKLILKIQSDKAAS